ncbi:lipoprotein [Pasteurella oralis]|uniref:Type IV secretion system putative lipoprotein virB7 n=1 Tax=Pasteurella oralis TaxID=1071947 RepID=A0ABW4NS13_9PAST
MKKLLPTLLIAVVLSGCSARAILVQKKTAYDPTTDARIRIYQSNGNKTTKILSATSCKQVQEGQKQIRSRNPFKSENTHNGLPRRTLKSVSIGMPQTQYSVDTLKRDSYFDTVSFIEQRIIANEPAIVSGTTWFGTTGYVGNAKTHSNTYCEINAEFMPKAGVDYELHYQFTGKECSVRINTLTPLETPTGKVTAKVGENVPLKRCK